MIGRLLPLIGTGSLIALVTMLGLKATKVLQANPAFSVEQVTSATKAPEITSPPAQVLQRPAVYYTAIADRPLFEPSRRPFIKQDTSSEPAPEPIVEAPASTEPTELPPPELMLQGVMTMDNNTVALIGINGGTPAWVPKGESVSDWTLSEIGSDWIEISRDARRIRVEMYK